MVVQYSDGSVTGLGGPFEYIWTFWTKNRLLSVREGRKKKPQTKLF